MIAATTWEHWQFGLIVTGEGEEKGVEKLFRPLTSTGLCSFKVIRRIGQLSPITSPKRKLKMTGTGRTIPDKDVQNIGFPARQHIQAGNGRFVIVIDDLEWNRRKQVQAVFKRYRDALDSVLTVPGDRAKASVHFLVMMLEAYFFADSQAINAVFNLSLSDRLDDVETIRHPKGDLIGLCQGYHEVDHGTAITGKLCVDHILAPPKCCAYLRTLFNWCLARLAAHPSAGTVTLPQYPGGIATVTGNQ